MLLVKVGCRNTDTLRVRLLHIELRNAVNDSWMICEGIVLLLGGMADLLMRTYCCLRVRESDRLFSEGWDQIAQITIAQLVLVILIGH